MFWNLILWWTVTSYSATYLHVTHTSVTPRLTLSILLQNLNIWQWRWITEIELSECGFWKSWRIPYATQTIFLLKIQPCCTFKKKLLSDPPHLFYRAAICVVPAVCITPDAPADNSKLFMISYKSKVSTVTAEYIYSYHSYRIDVTNTPIQIISTSFSRE